MTDHQREFTAEADAEAEAVTSPKHVLLVDDEPIIVATLADALTRAGFEVTAATTAAEANERARRTRYSLAILDYSMPGDNGLEVAASFTELHQPFMFLTAYNDETLVERAISAGALAYIVKPIDPSQFVPTVKAAVRRAGEITALLAQTDRLWNSISTHRDVSVAVGLVMAQRGMSRQAAYETLRQHARRIRRPLRELAAEVTAGAEKMYGIPRADLPEPSTTGRGRGTDSEKDR
jgi:two-component system, response regulator PdtaR